MNEKTDRVMTEKRVILQIGQEPRRFRSSYIDLLDIEQEDGKIDTTVVRDALLASYEINETEEERRTSSIFYDTKALDSILTKVKKQATKREQAERIYLPIRVKRQDGGYECWYMIYIDTATKRIYFYSNLSEEERALEREQVFYATTIKTISAYFNLSTDFEQFIITLNGVIDGEGEEETHILNQNELNLQFLAVVEQIYKISGTQLEPLEGNVIFIERNSLSLTRSQLFDRLLAVQMGRAPVEKNVFNVLVPFLANFKDKFIPMLRSLTNRSTREFFIVISIELCRVILQKIGIYIYSFITDMKTAMGQISAMEEDQVTAIMKIFSNQDNVVNNQNEKILTGTSLASVVRLESLYIREFLKLEKSLEVKYGEFEWKTIVYNLKSGSEYEKYAHSDEPLVSDKAIIQSKIIDGPFLPSFALIEDSPHNKTQTTITDLVSLNEHITGLKQDDRSRGAVSNRIVADMVSLLMPDPKKEQSGDLTGNLFFIPLFWSDFILKNRCPPVLRSFLRGRLKAARLVTIPILDTKIDTWSLAVLFIQPDEENPGTSTIYVSVWADAEHVNLHVDSNYLSSVSVSKKPTLSYQYYFAAYVRRYFTKHSLFNGKTHQWVKSNTHKVAVKVTEYNPHERQQKTVYSSKEAKKMRRKLQFLMGLNAFYRNRFDLLYSPVTNYTAICLYFSEAQKIDGYISLASTDPDHPESPESIYRGVNYKPLNIGTVFSILISHMKRLFNLQPIQFIQRAIDNFVTNFPLLDTPVNLDHLPVAWEPFFTQFQTITKSSISLNNEFQFVSLSDLLIRMKYPVDSGQKNDLQTIERQRLSALLDKRLVNIIVAFVIEDIPVITPEIGSKEELRPHAILIGTEKSIIEAYQRKPVPLPVIPKQKQKKEVIKLPPPPPPLVIKDEPTQCETTESRTILPPFGHSKVHALGNSKRIIFIQNGQYSIKGDQKIVQIPDIEENGVFQNNLMSGKENESFLLKQFITKQKVPSPLYRESIRLIRSEDAPICENVPILPLFNSRSVPPMSKALTYQVTKNTSDGEKTVFITIPTSDFFDRFENRPISPVKASIIKNDKRPRTKATEEERPVREMSINNEEHERLVISVWSIVNLRLRLENTKEGFLAGFKPTDSVFIDIARLMKTEKDPEPDVNQVLEDIASLYYDQEQPLKVINEALRSMWKKKALEQNLKKQKLSSIVLSTPLLSTVEEERVIEIKVSIGLFGGRPRHWISNAETLLLLKESQSVRELLQEVTNWVNSQPIGQKITLKSLQMQDFEPKVEDLDKPLSAFDLPSKGLIIHLWNPLLSD